MTSNRTPCANEPITGCPFDVYNDSGYCKACAFDLLDAYVLRIRTAQATVAKFQAAYDALAAKVLP